jgi:hypothetical protein
MPDDTLRDVAEKSNSRRRSNGGLWGQAIQIAVDDGQSVKAIRSLAIRTRYDVLVQRFATEEGIFVMESGATAFLPFWGVMADTC